MPCSSVSPACSRRRSGSPYGHARYGQHDAHLAHARQLLTGISIGSPRELHRFSTSARLLGLRRVDVLHMSLLGEQAITDDRAGSVQARSSRVVTLVAFLTVHAGSAQSRQRIAGLLWPESTGTQALTNLRRELH